MASKVCENCGTVVMANMIKCPSCDSRVFVTDGIPPNESAQETQSQSEYRRAKESISSNAAPNLRVSTEASKKETGSSSAIGLILVGSVIAACLLLGVYSLSGGFDNCHRQLAGGVDVIRGTELSDSQISKVCSCSRRLVDKMSKEGGNELGDMKRGFDSWLGGDSQNLNVVQIAVFQQVLGQCSTIGILAP
jgi:hypothetical protein